MGQIREQKLAASLKEILKWIYDWDPDFAQDNEWSVVRARDYVALWEMDADTPRENK